MDKKSHSLMKYPNVPPAKFRYWLKYPRNNEPQTIKLSVIKVVFRRGKSSILNARRTPARNPIKQSPMVEIPKPLKINRWLNQAPSFPSQLSGAAMLLLNKYSLNEYPSTES